MNDITRAVDSATEQWRNAYYGDTYNPATKSWQWTGPGAAAPDLSSTPYGDLSAQRQQYRGDVQAAADKFGGLTDTAGKQSAQLVSQYAQGKVGTEQQNVLNQMKQAQDAAASAYAAKSGGGSGQTAERAGLQEGAQRFAMLQTEWQQATQLKDFAVKASRQQNQLLGGLKSDQLASDARAAGWDKMMKNMEQQSLQTQNQVFTQVMATVATIGAMILLA